MSAAVLGLKINDPVSVPLMWSRQCLAGLDPATIMQAPVLEPHDVQRVLPGLDVWDSWPLADASGMPVAWRCGELWFALAAPAFDDPEQRHGHARIHHFHRRSGRFHHLGGTLPDGFSPGSREWSGAARMEGDEAALYFTATGQRGEGAETFRQRLFVTRSPLPADDSVVFTGWSPPCELITPGGSYQGTDQSNGKIGEIKAFRDPFPWREADGSEYLLFSLATSLLVPALCYAVIAAFDWHAIEPAAG